MERKPRSPKEEKPIKSNKLDSLPSGQIIPFDRFPNFHKWVTQCRLQQSAAKQSECKNSDKDEKCDKYSLKKGRKNFDDKDSNREGGSQNKKKKKSGERSGIQESKCDVLEKVNVFHDNSTRNEKTNRTKLLEEGNHPTDGVKSLTKKEKLRNNDKTMSTLRKRPHTVNVLQRMKTHSDSVRNKHFTGIVENKSVIIHQNMKKENVRENKAATPNRAHTANVQSRPITPKLQKVPPQTPPGQSKPHTPVAQSRPNTPNILFKKQDYTSSRGDKKIQKIVEKVDGSCVFIKAAVESRNERVLKENHANVHKRSHSAFRTLQRMRAFTDSVRTKRLHRHENEIENPDDTDDSNKSAPSNEHNNSKVEYKKIAGGFDKNIENDVKIVKNKPQSEDVKLKNKTDSLNNFVDEMERSFINKNYVATSAEEQKKNNFFEVPKLESNNSVKKTVLNASASKPERPQSANNVLLQKARCTTKSYRNFVDEMERSYPRYNFGEVTKVKDEIMDKSSDKSITKIHREKNKDDNKTEILINTNRQKFFDLNKKVSPLNDWNFENQSKKAKSLSYLKNTFDIGEDKLNTSHTILREKIGQYVKVCVPDICGKRIIKSIEGKIDDLERIINEKLKIGYESTDLGNHFAMFKNVPDVFNSSDKKDVTSKSSTTIAKPSNKFISNAGLIKYMEEKIEAYEKKYSYNFCNEAFITNLHDKVDALQKCIPMILNIDKPKCQDVQCFTSDSFLKTSTNNETQIKKVNEADRETSEIWEVALENVENKKGKNDSSKPQAAKQDVAETNRQGEKPVNPVEDAKKVLAQAQNLFNPPKVFRVQSAASLDNSKDKIVDGSVNKNFSLITTQKSMKMEEYKNFLRKYKIVQFDDIKSLKTPALRTSKEEKKSPFFTLVNSNATSSSQNKEFEEMCAERHTEVIENLQKRIEHFKNSSRISELRSKIDEIKSSISRVTSNARNTSIESDNNNVNVICSVKNYLEESDSVMETSCEDLLKVSEDITNLDEEIKHCKTQLAFYQSISGGENVGKNGEPSKFITESEKSSRCTFSPRLKYRTQIRPKSANAKYSKTAFGGITKIIKNLQTKMDQHDKFYQNCNEVASALTNHRVAPLELSCPVNSSSEVIQNMRGAGKLLSRTDVDAKESDLISLKAIENLKVKVDSLTETCNVANIRELQNKLDSIEKASSIVAHSDIIKTLQAKIEKLEITLENQTNLIKNKDSTETLYSCSSSKTFTNKSSDSKNLFDEMPACTYCMAVTLDHKPNLISWDKS